MSLSKTLYPLVGTTLCGKKVSSIPPKERFAPSGHKSFPLIRDAIDDNNCLI